MTHAACCVFPASACESVDYRTLPQSMLPSRTAGWIDCLDETPLFYALLPISVFFKVCFLWYECECNVPVLLQVDAGRAVVSAPTGLVFCGVHHSIHSFLMLFVDMEACHAAFWMEPKSRALQRFVETCSVKICQRLSFHATIYLQVPGGGGEARGDRRESGGRRCAWGKDATRRGNNGSRRGRDARGLIALPWLPITSTYIGDLWGIAWTNWS